MRLRSFFFVQPGELDFCFGETTLFSIAVQKYAMQGTPICKDDFSLAELFKCIREKIDTRSVVFIEGVRTYSPLAELLTKTGSPVSNFFHVCLKQDAWRNKILGDINVR